MNLSALSFRIFGILFIFLPLVTIFYFIKKNKRIVAHVRVRSVFIFFSGSWIGCGIISMENKLLRQKSYCVRDLSGALNCFAESNLFYEIAFCKAIKAGTEARPSRFFREGHAQMNISLFTGQLLFSTFFYYI